jgi:NAD(P)-dependent dehydrogenase (short-subunit alcohol dehydrogenase family)
VPANDGLRPDNRNHLKDGRKPAIEPNSGASAALRGRAAFAAFAAAKAGLRMVSQSFAREFGPRGIHVAHVIIDGSINGDKIFSKVPENQNMSHPVRT